MAVSVTGRISKMQCLKAGLSRRFLRSLICQTHQCELQRGGLATKERAAPSLVTKMLHIYHICFN